MTVSISSIQPSVSGNALSSKALAGHVGRTVVEARLAAGYSVDDLAVTTGLVHEEILGVEEGSDFDPGKLKRIAAALKLPASTLLVA